MNKRFKKFATVGLAAVMALTIAGTALAAGRGGNNTARQSTGSVATCQVPSAVPATPLSDAEKDSPRLHGRGRETGPRRLRRPLRHLGLQRVPEHHDVRGQAHGFPPGPDRALRPDGPDDRQRPWRVHQRGPAGLV